jgi:hypothetical protein
MLQSVSVGRICKAGGRKTQARRSARAMTVREGEIKGLADLERTLHVG